MLGSPAMAVCKARSGCTICCFTAVSVSEVDEERSALALLIKLLTCCKRALNSEVWSLVNVQDPWEEPTPTACVNCPGPSLVMFMAGKPCSRLVPWDEIQSSPLTVKVKSESAGKVSTAWPPNVPQCMSRVGCTMMSLVPAPAYRPEI